MIPGRDASGEDGADADEGQRDRYEGGKPVAWGAGFDRLDFERNQDVVPELGGHGKDATTEPKGRTATSLTEPIKVQLTERSAAGRQAASDILGGPSAAPI